jgi:hypothetical protein
MTTTTPDAVDEAIEKLFLEHMNKITNGRIHGVNRVDLHRLTFRAGYEAAMEFVRKENNEANTGLR